MNKQDQTIHNLLANWGKSQRVPNNNPTIINSIANSLAVPSIEPVKSSRLRWWLPLSIAGLGLFCIVLIGPFLGGDAKISNRATNTYQMDSALRMSEPSPGISSDVANSLPSFREEIPITDTRQFLKTDYNATVSTRNTQEITGRIQTMIRGYEGRVDQVSSSEESGSISFVIPADKLESFRSELIQLTGARFISEQTNTQNLLSQKQVIEQNWETTETTLVNLTAQRTQLVSVHDTTLKNLESQLATNNRQIANYQLEIKNFPERRSQIEPLINQSVKANDRVVSQIANENANHFNELNSVNAQIDSLQKDLENIDKQDDQLMDTVATVRGSITVSSMNFWQWIGFYLPAYWPMYITVIALATAFILRSRRPKWEI